MKKHHVVKHIQAHKNNLMTGWAIVALAVAVGIIIVTLTRASGSASFSLEPASGARVQNTNFTISVYENSGSEEVNAVDARMNYDQTKLQFVSLSNSGSAFEQCPVKSGGNGSVRFACGVPGGGESVSGKQLIGTMTFKALAASGNTAITFASNSLIIRYPEATQAWNGNTTGGTYSFTSAPTTPTPSPSTSPSPSPSASVTPASTTSPTPKPSTTKTPTPTPSASPTTPPPTPSTSPSAEPLAGDPNDEGIPTYIVAIKVSDADGKPVSGAKVTLGTKTATTDPNGVASFISIPAGDYTAVVKSDKGDATISVVVAGSDNLLEVQEFAAVVRPSMTWLYLLFGLGGLVGLGGIGFALFKAGRLPGMGGSSPGSATAIAGEMPTAKPFVAPAQVMPEPPVNTEAQTPATPEPVEPTPEPAATPTALGAVTNPSPTSSPAEAATSIPVNPPSTEPTTDETPQSPSQA